MISRSFEDEDADWKPSAERRWQKEQAGAHRGGACHKRGRRAKAGGTWKEERRWRGVGDQAWIIWRGARASLDDRPG
ncbi:uncharacterized protein SPSK_10434 [Sporothrix schenckii 1099-18]|uniref:Uncharacterized protein n=1 Tax=Sporothrix schenckii 1099-18 TaxID=1397361 RepID=A0A0F2MGN1_SPOSC|nr:uncharacterized protein SPSK_10434 [Sporothrix schenckii 1099-18]KJR87326.1 hypothetical protein SPSK_10434 [Sporothrix schenckii 1099-18]